MPDTPREQMNRYWQQRAIAAGMSQPLRQAELFRQQETQRDAQQQDDQNGNGLLKAATAYLAAEADFQKLLSQNNAQREAEGYERPPVETHAALVRQANNLARLGQLTTLIPNAAGRYSKDQLVEVGQQSAEVSRQIQSRADRLINTSEQKNTQQTSLTPRA